MTLTFNRPWDGNEVAVQPWGLREPSEGEICVAADSALKWQWNAIRCIISADVNCEGNIQNCHSPTVHPGSYIKKQGMSKARKYGLYKVGEEIQYECQQGFAMHRNGSENRTCSKNGTWTGNAPLCTFYDCKLPTVNEEGKS